MARRIGIVVAIMTTFAIVLARPSQGPGAMPADARVNASREAEQADRQPERSPLRTGAGSCAAGACHGSAQPVADVSVLRNEHTTWITKDPHSGSYATLLEPRSIAIAEALGRRTGRVTAAHEDVRCLACHAPVGLDQTGALASVPLARDGVSCEACHGSAGNWLDRHTTADWPVDPEAKAQQGLARLDRYGFRAQVCAGCHVGSSGSPGGVTGARDVNHDLIAAGHPRLAFELGTLWSRYPKHWRETLAQPDDEARIWAVGQIAGAEAAIELLHDRAMRASNPDANLVAPWPELSQYGCFSCHFSLPGQQIGQAATGGATLGKPRWGSWELANLDLLAGPSSGIPAPAGWTGFADLKAAMGAFDSDPKRVAELAAAARPAFSTWIRDVDQAALPAQTVRALLESIPRSSGPTPPPAWDEAAQRYLARVALFEALRSLEPASATAAAESELTAELQRLTFPPGFDSPGGAVNLRRSP
jgi:hypothetical protein